MQCILSKGPFRMQCSMFAEIQPTVILLQLLHSVIHSNTAPSGNQLTSQHVVMGSQNARFSLIGFGYVEQITQCRLACGDYTIAVSMIAFSKQHPHTLMRCNLMVVKNASWACHSPCRPRGILMLTTTAYWPANLPCYRLILKPCLCRGNTNACLCRRNTNARPCRQYAMSTTCSSAMHGQSTMQLLT